MFATNPLGVTSAYHQHVQHLDWPVAERTLLGHAITLLRHRVGHAPPPSDGTETRPDDPRTGR